MTEVHPGDVILHYARGVAALSEAATEAIDSRRPGELPEGLWQTEGRLVRTVYRKAFRPVTLDEVPVEWRRGHTRLGPFQENAAVKTGYLFPLSSDFGDLFVNQFAERFPPASAGMPAELADDAVDLLRRLIGIPLTTVQGRPNRIIGLELPHVLVATERSPEGRSVRIEPVQQALEALRRDGRVNIEPDAIGHRSAFVGAVLLTLPGAAVVGSPPVLTLLPPDLSAASAKGDVVTFEGDLSHYREVEQRGEQATLRRRLFGTSMVAQCALCGETYPVQFLVAAHIKPRSICTQEQRRDLAHIAMAACAFGCDSLFETGYVAVADDGRVITTRGEHGSALERRLSRLEGRACVAFTDSSRDYFKWHRGNRYRGSLG